MTASRFREIRDAVATARRLDAGARARFLDDLDPGIRGDVESLLSHDRAPANIVQTGALARGLGEQLRPALDEIRRAGLPAAIGPYVLGEPLGEGGMGVVFRATQTAPIRREVALKLLRQAGDPERVRVRFEAELQTLAAMNHPGIAKVFDAGVHEGRPYFAMELVPGVPVTEHCDAHARDVRSRLRLFLEICDAVRHAHQRGIIHRDIKPSNVLVADIDGTHRVKVIDFGIATAVEGPGRSATAMIEALGTPAYMSPEQAERSGDGSIDTRTDVYSLGVLLYELLTAKLPYDITADTTLEALREIASREAPTPPSRVSVRRGLDGDLDAIVLRAIARRREDRYDSVDKLAADIERHLTGHPVLARGDARMYRSLKFVRRHLVSLSVAAIFVALLVGFAATTAIQTQRIAAERDRALAAEREARRDARTTSEVLDFLVGVFDVADPSSSGGEEMTVRDVLAKGVERIRTELVNQPVVRARLLHTLAVVYHSLGDVERGSELAEEAYALRLSILGEQDPEVAESIEFLGILAHDQGEYERAIELGRRALAIQIASSGEMDPEVATTMSGIASSIQATGHPEEAEPLLRRALEIHRATLGEDHQDVAWDLNLLGWSLHAQGRLADAAPFYEEALEVQRGLFGDRHPDVAGTLNNLSGLRLNLGDLGAAETGFREALLTYEVLYGDAHAAVARAHTNYASTLLALGRYDEAIAHADSSYRIVRQVLGEEHPYVAGSLTTLGRAYVGAGRVDAGIERFREAIEMRKRLGLETHPAQAGTYVQLAGALREEGHFDAAEASAQRALAILEDGDHADGARYGAALYALGRARLDAALAASRKGEWTGPAEDGAPTAESLLRRALDEIESERPSTYWDAAEARVALGLAIRVADTSGARHDEAHALAARGHADLVSVLGDAHPLTEWAAESLARIDGED